MTPIISSNLRVITKVRSLDTRVCSWSSVAWIKVKALYKHSEVHFCNYFCYRGAKVGIVTWNIYMFQEKILVTNEFGPLQFFRKLRPESFTT